jgi:hypothetical protein
MNEIVAALQQLDPESSNFHDGLSDAMNVLAATPERDRPFALIFRFMEDHPAADFGAPGPIVHAMEKLGGYHDALAESIERHPIPLTLWMVNRILNSRLPAGERTRWVEALRRTAADPKASPEAREEASSFLRHQEDVT